VDDNSNTVITDDLSRHDWETYFKSEYKKDIMLLENNMLRGWNNYLDGVDDINDPDNDIMDPDLNVDVNDTIMDPDMERIRDLLKNSKDKTKQTQKVIKFHNNLYQW